MKSLIKAFDDLPFIVKLILCIPALDVIWSIYKIARSAVKSNIIGIILGVLTIVPGAFFIWIVDIITVIVNGKVWWLD